MDARDDGRRTMDDEWTTDDDLPLEMFLRRGARSRNVRPPGARQATDAGAPKFSPAEAAHGQARGGVELNGPEQRRCRTRRDGTTGPL